MATEAGERITVGEAVKRTGRYPATIYSWIAAKRLKKVRGKVDVAELLTLCKERPQRGKKKGKAKHSAKKIFAAASETDVSKVADLLKVIKPDGYLPSDYETMLNTVRKLNTLVEGSDASASS